MLGKRPHVNVVVAVVVHVGHGAPSAFPAPATERATLSEHDALAAPICVAAFEALLRVANHLRDAETNGRRSREALAENVSAAVYIAERFSPFRGACLNSTCSYRFVNVLVYIS